MADERRVFRFGALSPKLSDQLMGELPREELKWLDRYAESVTLLMVHGLLSEAEAQKARQRIVKRIGQLLRDHEQKAAKRG